MNKNDFDFFYCNYHRWKFSTRVMRDIPLALTLESVVDKVKRDYRLQISKCKRINAKQAALAPLLVLEENYEDEERFSKIKETLKLSVKIKNKVQEKTTNSLKSQVSKIWSPTTKL